MMTTCIGALFTTVILLLLLSTLPARAQQDETCQDLIENGIGNSTVCRVFPGPDCSDTCTANGTCFDEGFCCPRGFELCGVGFATISACYDPRAFSCCGMFSSPGGTAPVLCPASTDPLRERACVRAGFDRPGCITTDPDLIPPSFPPNECRQQVYNPDEYICLSGLVLCPKSAHIACNEDCFDPQKFTCTADIRFIDGNPLQNFQLCPVDAPFLYATHTDSQTEKQIRSVLSRLH